MIQPFGEKAYKFISNPIEDDAKITILHGSVRSSKTWAMHPKILQLVKHFSKVQGMGVITGVSKEAIYDNVLRDLFNIIGEKNYSYNRQTGDLRLFMEPGIKVIGAKDEGSEKYIRGKTVKWAYGDELTLMPESFFHQLLNRMSPPGARFYGTTNPDSPYHHLYTDFINDKKKLDSGLVRSIHFCLDDNPNITEEYKNFIKASHSGVFFQRAVEGKWVVAEGAIYRDSWSDDLIYTDMDRPVDLYVRSVERLIGIDYGTANAQVYLDILDDGKTLWIDNEYYWDSQKEAKQKTDSEYADDLEKFIARGEGKPTQYAQTILDPSAASFEAELINRGIPVLPADNEVLDGIRMVASMLKLKMIRIHERCVHLIEELQNYSWDEKACARGDEKPVKEKDHSCDTLRYTVKTKIPEWRLAA